MGAKVSVIIPTANRQDLLRGCLQSLRQQTCADFEIIMVADGPGTCAREIAAEFTCKLLESPVQRGFAAAINRGVAASKAEYIALLNDDAQLDRDWLRHTLSLLQNRPELAFCCGKIYKAGGTVLDNAGDAVSRAGSAWRLGHGRKAAEEFDVARPVFTCPGTASLLRRSVFAKYGGFDEAFFAYLEDIDLSLRAARGGAYGVYLPQAKSTHWGGATSGGAESAFVIRQLTQNQLLVLAKNFPWQLCFRWAARIAWAQILWAAMAVRKKRLRAYLSGICGFLRRSPHALRQRTSWSRDEVAAFKARLEASEQEIYEDVCAPDCIEKDTFWKLYFAPFPTPRLRPSSMNPGLGRLPVR
ncbi:MAG: glycosyltransferase family 2 protein [Acidobacteria bacterium]|nr:glycosyltransferase family 2 protein [Acidobacteriota bacterium]